VGSNFFIDLHINILKMRYLDPKNDLTFKKVFGEHPHLLKSFLNAIMPFKENQLIVDLEYLPVELIPEVPLMKYTIVDVRCKDTTGRQFIVEMQMCWTDDFKQRVLFNASRAYVRQLGKGQGYRLLQPVYAVSLINDIFEPDTPQYYHHYQIIQVDDISKHLEGLEFIFVELPKFRPHSITEKRLQVLWLRYLTEIKDGTNEIANELLSEPEVEEAINYIQESAYTEEELEYYDRYWDSIQTEKTFYEAAKREGMEEGIEEGRKEGRKEGIEKGIEKGRKEEKIEIAKKCLQKGMDISEIIELTGLSKEEIEKLK
jgi:predicted transposase/invertase (TIGR01784 family)